MRTALKQKEDTIRNNNSDALDDDYNSETTVSIGVSVRGSCLFQSLSLERRRRTHFTYKSWAFRSKKNLSTLSILQEGNNERGRRIGLPWNPILKTGVSSTVPCGYPQRQLERSGLG